MTNERNGSGKGINRIHKVAGAVVCKTVDPTERGVKAQTDARGVRSRVDGTINVILLDQTGTQEIDVIAGVKELYDIKEVLTGGTIPLDGDSFYLFWQVNL